MKKYINNLYLLPNHIFINKSLINDSDYGLFTSKPIKKNGIVYKYDTIIWPTNKSGSYKKNISVDIYDNNNFKKKFKFNYIQHSEFNINNTLDFTGFDLLINHSCDFNCYYDRDMKKLRAYREIEKDEELYINYNLSNYDYKIEHNEIIDCLCKSKKCEKKIKGFKYLSDNNKKNLHKFTNKYVYNILTNTKKFTKKL